MRKFSRWSTIYYGTERKTSSVVENKKFFGCISCSLPQYGDFWCGRNSWSISMPKEPSLARKSRANVIHEFQRWMFETTRHTNWIDFFYSLIGHTRMRHHIVGLFTTLKTLWSLFVRQTKQWLTTNTYNLNYSDTVHRKVTNPSPRVIKQAASRTVVPRNAGNVKTIDIFLELKAEISEPICDKKNLGKSISYHLQLIYYIRRFTASMTKGKSGKQ